MKLSIVTIKRTICSIDAEAGKRPVSLLPRGFRLLSRIWLKQEWNQLHWQSFPGSASIMAISG
jgi:hypothetical protein